jgi:Rrf2 family protein
MLSRTVEYALRAVVHLAAFQPEPRTTEQISRATKVPRPYLYKVLQALGREGVVVSQRGLRGGISLGRKPADITILAVVDAVEPIQRIAVCPLGLAAHGSRLCPLHRRLDQALQMVEQAFGGSTLADLLGEPRPSPQACKFPRPASSERAAPRRRTSKRSS